MKKKIIFGATIHIEYGSNGDGKKPVNWRIKSDYIWKAS